MPRPLLHVVQISFFSDPAGRLPEELLEAWPSLVDVADAACRAGIRVSVVQASSHSQRLERNGVRYYFLPFGAALPEIRQSAAFGELLRHLAPDVLHVHGLGSEGRIVACDDSAGRPHRAAGPCKPGATILAASVVASRVVGRCGDHVLRVAAGAAVCRCRPRWSAHQVVWDSRIHESLYTRRPS